MTNSRVSALIGGIAPSATLAVDAKAKALRAAGESVIGFGAGEPDFPTPDHIVEAAVAACRDPKNHRYTPAGGLPELKEAIATKTARDSGYAIEPAQVTAADFIDRRSDDQSHFQSGNVPVPVSGFRINWPLNQPDKQDEAIVFQGASYFRALARGQQYGLSARGLAIGTASPEGEEFPEFREFWIEKPDDHALGIDIYALLDSPSASGAYHFRLQPGDVTFVDVDSVIYPRREIKNIGVAPLTSMYMLGPIDRMRKDDFRPEVHDSDGIAILNGRKERLWRPLSNPRTLQVSAFVDDGNKGFGLIQRERRFERYEDLEARYDLRPSAWVEPLSDFGAGSVMLVEIPTEREIHDNIVAFWRPEQPLTPGNPADFSYRLHWRMDAPTRDMGPRAATTRAGLDIAENSDEERYRFVIDYACPTAQSKEAEPPPAEVTASTGRIDNIVVSANPQTGCFRLSFEFFPEDADVAELRANVELATGQPVERWLYRWTPKQ